MPKQPIHTPLFRETMFRNPYWWYVRDRYRSHRGEEHDYHFVQTRGSVLVIPRLSDGRFVLTRQYRYLQQEWGLEFPGGGRKESQSPCDAASDELQEEVGYTAATFTHLGAFSPCVGIVDETCDVFLADDLTPAPAQPDASELLEVVTLTETEVDQAVREGTLWSGMSQAAWLLYKVT